MELPDVRERHGDFVILFRSEIVHGKEMTLLYADGKVMGAVIDVSTHRPAEEIAYNGIYKRYKQGQFSSITINIDHGDFKSQSGEFMMDKENFGSAYLYGEDLLDDGVFQKVVVTIETVHDAGTLTKADGKKIDKPSLSFVGKAKKLVLCKTNVSLLKYATGEASSAKWVGKKVTLVVRRVDAFGSQVPAIRVWPNVPIRKGLVKYLGEEIKQETVTT